MDNLAIIPIRSNDSAILGFAPIVLCVTLVTSTFICILIKISTSFFNIQGRVGDRSFSRVLSLNLYSLDRIFIIYKLQFALLIEFVITTLMVPNYLVKKLKELWHVPIHQIQFQARLASL